VRLVIAADNAPPRSTDHPHGGGRGKSKGNKHPRTPQGLKTKGRRTRRPVSGLSRFFGVSQPDANLLHTGTQGQQAGCAPTTSWFRASR
jgi:hypothetical protein